MNHFSFASGELFMNHKFDKVDGHNGIDLS